MKIKGKESAEHAIIAAIEYILTLQSDEGCWIDWQTPVGASDSWITAYVGYKLRSLPRHLQSVAPSEPILRVTKRTCYEPWFNYACEIYG